MPKLQSVIILLLNLFLVTGHELKQKLNAEKECTKFDHISDKSGAVELEETDHRHERNGIHDGKVIDSNKVIRNDESEALRMLSPVLDFVQSLKDRIDRIHDKVNIDHIQHSKQYQKENHQSFDYSQKYGYNNYYWNYRNPNEVNGMKIVNVTGVKNGDVKHGKVMEWNRFDPDIINSPGEYKILDHNGQETGDVKVEYTVNGKPWNPTADLGSLLPEVNLGLDDDLGIDINSEEENTEDMKYKTSPLWPGENREKKYKTTPIWPGENRENKYETMPIWPGENKEKKYNTMPIWPGENKEKKYNTRPIWPGENRENKYKTMPIWPGENKEKKYNTMPIWPGENKEKKYNTMPIWPGENRENKYKTMPIWPEENRENKYKTMPILPGEYREKKYEYLPTYGVKEFKKSEKERLAKKHSKKIYNRENIVTVNNKNGSYTISKHLEYSGDWSNGNHNEINGVKIVNVTGVKNGDIKHGKVLEWNRFDPLIINDPGEYKILDQNGRETGNININYTTFVDGIPWDPNEDIHKEERHSLYYADTSNQGKRGYSKTKYTNRYGHKEYSSSKTSLVPIF
ncbi:uncharacterized protein LOC121738037 isoform X2 [Aricia agestis]|uniref:uncharacterized protein LOC121738037 isoform X2 n=1 Tax=Aricia agestis TaxID=91739 RepID=UPI001C20A4A2|nr:uncharacterized protein LOC121738037 isoform X2 [Aricia agestis]